MPVTRQQDRNAARSPYRTRPHPIPVTVVTGSFAGGIQAPEVAVLRLTPQHAHAAGAACPACAAATDVRARLFDLLEAKRQGSRPAFARVIVDASGLPEAASVIDRLIPGKVPALGLRDHAVAKNFSLAEVLGDAD